MYLKVRDRTSYAYALTSAAVVLTLDAEGRIDHIRVALGGVGSVPWRSHEAENVLLRNPPTEAAFREAAEAAFAGGGALPVQRLQDRAGPGHAGPGPERTCPSRRWPGQRWRTAMIPKSIIGAGIDRVDGPLKVTGGAQYAGDTQLAGMVYAVPVLSTIARGNIVVHGHAAPP